MKNLFTCALLFVCGSILFTSCNQGLSLTKRHYKNGYHVEYASKRPTIKPNTNDAFVAAEQPSKDSKQPEVTPGADKIVKEAQTAEKAIIGKKNNSTIHKSNNQRSVFDDAVFKHVKPIVKRNTPRQLMKDNSKAFKNFKNSDEDAHSLFWIVITIIAILYLIALVTGGWGFGGAIHILLVIALVLLILWLLRII